jgi:hypothetical protein
MKLNFRSFLVSALVGIALSSSASAEIPKGVGFHLGLNLADVSMGGVMNSGSTFGYVLGSTYDYALAPNVSLLPGLQIAKRGFTFDVGLTEVDLKTIYLEIPMLIQVRFTGAPVLPFFIGGPVLGRKLGASHTVSSGATTIFDDSSIATFHLGLDIGGGVVFPLEGDTQLITQLRYHLGMTRMSGDLTNPRHRGLLMEVGYRF